MILNSGFSLKVETSGIHYVSWEIKKLICSRVVLFKYWEKLENHGCVENELSFGGNSNQAARNPFQIYGAGIIPENYTERAPKQTSNKKEN